MFQTLRNSIQKKLIHIFQNKYLNDCKSEIESFDNFIPPVKAIKAAIEKYSGEHGLRNKD